MKPRIYLSSPHMGGDEWPLLQDAFASNWIAPLGPHVDAFEREFAALMEGPTRGERGEQGAKSQKEPDIHAAALASGTRPCTWRSGG